MSIGVIFGLLMLIVPVPKALVDILMTLNLALGVLVLLTVINTPRASNFTSFPQVTLLVTLFGIGINVASTKLILSADGTNPAILAANQSAMVQAFANIVAGNNIVIGFVVFIMFIVLQMVVITKGATRVAEVSARFTLDAMSPKMLDIDSQLNSGFINEEQARSMKDDLRRDIDFYSNMDGASKFVSGNVTFGIFVTVINLIGGFAVGMGMKHLNWNDSLSIYTKLTIGDGLLSQIPSLVISFATGILVTADKSDETLGEQVKKNFSIDGTIYQIVGGFIIAMALAFHNSTSGFLIPIGALLVYYGFRLKTEKLIKEKAEQEAAANVKGKTQTGGSADDVENVGELDPLSLELGYALIPLVDEEKGAKLLERVTRIRKETRLDLGLIVPRIRIIDNMILEPSEYSFKILGIEAGKGRLKLGYYMAINTGDVREELKGEATQDPAFGMPAIWIPEDNRQEAENAGYAVVDPPTVIATHLTEIIRSHASEILGREETKKLVDRCAESNKIVVDEVMNTAKYTYGQIQKVLQNLLREQVSIRNMVLILETLANYDSKVSPWVLTEKVREALGKQICLQYADENKKLRVLNLSQNLSEMILNHQFIPTDGSRPYVALDPVDGRRWISTVSQYFAEMRNNGYQPIILCPAEIRQLVKASTERELPGIVVISINEVLAAGSTVQLEVLGEIKDEGEDAING